MTDPLEGGTVLRAGRPAEAMVVLRRRFDRRNLWTAVACAILFHILIILIFWLIDVLGVRDLSDWTGPMLVKIGAPEAPVSSQPDPGPLPDQSEVEVAEPLEPTEMPLESPEETSPAESSPAKPESSPDANRPTPKDTSAVEGGGEAVESPFEKPRSAPPPQPSRVQGSEDGNNYFIDFEGTENEVGRAAAYDFITYYMPLPEVLDEALIEGAVAYIGMSPDFIRGEISRYWEPVFGEYVKKRGSSVPLADRPYYWGILEKSLGYNLADADWRSPGMRPVKVQFTVGPSEGTWGADLTDFKIVSQTNNPAIDQAVIFGLSKWVYYNDTGRPVRGEITYSFNGEKR